jgi:hypothetical protein
MELKAYFTNIYEVIIDHLEEARFEIVAAVAWFTDRDIFEVLCKKASSGISVSVALIGDDINQGSGALNFPRLEAAGGKVTFLSQGSRDEPTMHHKFCVIDRHTVITGSYNWSRKARRNDENITVVTDSTEFAGKYLDTFETLLTRAGYGGPMDLDADAVRRRLEMIRNLILLGEQDDVTPHVSKLRPVAEAIQVTRIIAALDSGEYRAALEEIDAYLQKATALVVVGYADIARLRFVLESLELRLESLSDEKADLERRLITFNRRHDEALGDLIQLILKAQAELARLVASRKGDEKREAEAAAQDAEEAYNNYSKQHAELRTADPLPKLDDDAERELKSLYRKACSLCHPDKVPEEKKDYAHVVFVQLQEVYKRNDLAGVRAIHEALAAGGMPGTRSTTLAEVDALKAAIAELEYAFDKLVSELKAVQECDCIRLMDAAGTSEADWERYFTQQRELLEMELARFVSEIMDAQTEEVSGS